MTLGDLAPTRPRRFACTLAVVSIPALGFIGCILGLLVTGAATRGWFSRWHSLGAPLENPHSIVAVDFTQIFVETDSGLLFEFEAENSLWSGQAPVGTWAQASDPQVEEFSKCDHVAPKGPPAPEAAKDFIQFGYCPESSIDVRYALLTDGSVWRWSTPESMSIAFTAIPVGIALGLVAGLAMTVIVWRRAARLPSKVSGDAA